MRIRSLLVVLSIFLLVLARPVLADDIASVVKSDKAFALDMYRQLENGPGGIAFSPYSISTALAMTYAGAAGNTEIQMANVLHINLGHAEFHQASGDLAKTIEADAKTGGYEFSIANSLWVQTGYGLQKDFLDVLADKYGAAPREVDFASNPEAQRLIINNWVEDKTKTRIKDLIAQGMLTDLTRLVLVNALYFKGNWVSKFDPATTVDGDFYPGNGGKAKSRLMNQTKDFRYYEDSDIQALELPYAGEKFSMVVLLPRSPDLAALEKDLTAGKLDQYLSGLSSMKVDVTLPKFKAEAGFVLNEKLEALGMPDAFDQNLADFRGMDGKKDLYIGYVIHKAFVEVDENGSEAAAATAVVMDILDRGPMDEPPPKVFRADHPFIFLIRDNETGSILFMGRVMDPAQ